MGTHHSVSEQRLVFTGPLVVESNGDGYVVAPESIVNALGGGRARIPIVGSVRGHTYHSSTRPLGDGRHGIRVYKAVRETDRLVPGEAVTIEVERDLSRGGA